LVVTKGSAGQRTAAAVERVEGTAREREVARMLGGVRGSENRLALAAELLEGKKENQAMK
jgi:DNA repair ATPase RecN